MKAIMVNASPKICERVANRDCTILVKKSTPKIEGPIKCYIYCTKESKRRYLDHRFNTAIKGLSHHSEMGKVIGEFICDRVYYLSFSPAFQDYNFEEIYKDNDKREYFSLRKTCLTQNEIYEYGKGKTLYGWHISNLVIYDTPKSLEMFPTGRIARDCGYGNYMVYDKILTRPPRDWCYVEDKEN